MVALGCERSCCGGHGLHQILLVSGGALELVRICLTAKVLLSGHLRLMAVESRVRGTIVNCVLGGSYPLVDVAKHLVSHQVHVTVVWLI